MRVNKLLIWVVLVQAVFAVCACTNLDASVTAGDKIGDDIARSTLPTSRTPTAYTHQSDSHAPRRALAKRFNVSVTNLPAKAFFLSLVADAGVNVVTEPDLDGMISLDLKNVTVPEVLAVTREVYGYEYTFDNGVYIIRAQKVRSEVFDVNYLNISRESSTETTVAIGAISNGGGSADSAQSNSGGGNAAGGGANSGPTSGTTIVTKNSSDFWMQLEKTLAVLVGAGDGRSVIVNPQSSVVVVTAMPEELARVRQYLNRTQMNVARQVILEAKIIEVTLGDAFDAGINWEQLGHRFAYSHNVSAFDSSPAILGQSDSGDIFSSVVVVNDIFRLLNFLETQGKVQVLSSPRVSTVNNQKAIIRVGTDEFFVTGVKSNTTASAATTTTSPEVELTSFFSGISLDITPQISAQGDIVLHVHPLVSSVQDQQKVFTIGNDAYDLPLALREIRESDSIVRAKSGEVVVLGGLIQESSSQEQAKRPFLGQLPILKYFFTTQKEKTTKKELVILMRPVIVENKTWQNDLLQSQQRFDQLGNELEGFDEAPGDRLQPENTRIPPETGAPQSSREPSIIPVTMTESLSVPQQVVTPVTPATKVLAMPATSANSLMSDSAVAPNRVIQPEPADIAEPVVFHAEKTDSGQTLAPVLPTTRLNKRVSARSFVRK
jgi:MSHA biogenesis protein MshL